MKFQLQKVFKRYFPCLLFKSFTFVGNYIKEYYTNSTFTDYIKTIKEEANKELSGLDKEQENNIN